jgi:hypothetical protein
MPTYQQLLEALQGMSASGTGTAIVYSGQQTDGTTTTTNKQLALDCQDLYPNSTYTIFQTQAGQYLTGTVQTAYDAGAITTAQYQNLWNVASQMMTQQASGPVLAFVDGSLPTPSNNPNGFGTFENYELPTLLGNSNVTSINGIDVTTLDNAANGNPSANFQNVLNLLGSASSCFDGTPPTASAPVTDAVTAIQDDVPSQFTSSVGPTTVVVPPSDSGSIPTWEVALGVGVTVVGLGVIISGGVAAAAATVAAGIAALTGEAAGAQPPAASSGSNPIPESLYDDEVQSYQALGLAPAFADMRADALVAAGNAGQAAIQNLPSAQTSFNDLASTLQSNGNAVSGTLALSSGQQINVGASLATNGNITYTESATGSQSDGSDLLSNNGNPLIASQTDVFNSSGTNLNNTFNFVSGGSQTQTLTSSSGTITEQETGYTGSNGTGTQLYTQTTTLPSSGEDSASISGTGDDTDLSNAAISLAANASATVAGTADAIAAGAGAAATLSNATVGGDGITLSSGTETLALSNGMDVTVGSGTHATVTGTDGTLTASDPSSGPITNTIDWLGGSSQTQSYSVSGSTSTQTNLGYTGTNGGGTELYDQTITDTSGTITDAISGSGYYTPVSGSTWTGIATNVIGGELNGPQLQALNIAIGGPSTVTPGDAVYLPVAQADAGPSPTDLSSAAFGANGETYAYIQQTGFSYAIGANPTGASVNTVYALTTNGDSFADDQAGTTTIADNQAGTVTLASAPASGVTDTMTLGDTGNDDSFALESLITASFGSGALASLTDDDDDFNFTKTTGTIGGIDLNPTTNAIVESLVNATITLAAGVVAAATGIDDILNMGSGTTLSLDGDTSDTVDLNGGGSLSIGSGGAITLSDGSAADSFGAGTLASIDDSSTPWINLASGGSDQLQLNPVSGITSIFANFTGSDGTGTLNSYTENLSGGTSILSQQTGLASGVSQLLSNYSGLNDGGSLTATTTNMNAGNSTVEYFNPNSTTATDIQNWSGLNGGGSDLGNMLEMDDGTSQSQTFSDLPSGVTQENLDYSGADGSGTQTSVIYDFTTGNSQQQITTDLPSGEEELINNWNGLNQTGTEVNTITDYTAGNSQLEEYNPTSDISTVFAQFSGLNASGQDESNLLNLTDGKSQLESYADLPSNQIETITGYSDQNLSGNENFEIYDNSNDTSVMELVNPTTNSYADFQDFSGLNGTGDISTATIDNNDGTSVAATYEYSGNAIDLIVAKYSSDAGTLLGTAEFEGDGVFLGGYHAGTEFAGDTGVIADTSGVGGYGGYGGGLDGNYELTGTAKATGSNIGVIAQSDITQGDSPAAAAAEAGRSEISLLAQLASTNPTLADGPFYEDAKWNSTVITWSLADSPGTNGAAFSSYMSPQYQALVAAAFAEWGAASGLIFEQVSDSSQSDIRIGFSDLDTASSGVVGYTSSPFQNGQFQPGVTIQLEDPSQDALVGSGSSATYSASQADLYQVVLHEIGHALGLADNADPNSVMYYQASNNVTLDSNDIAGIQALYGPDSTLSFAPSAAEATVNAQIQQLIQATVSYHTDLASSTAFVPPQITVVPTLLAASQHS